MGNKATILSLINGVKQSHEGEDKEVIREAIVTALRKAGIKYGETREVLKQFGKCRTIRELEEKLAK